MGSGISCKRDPTTQASSPKANLTQRPSTTLQPDAAEATPAAVPVESEPCGSLPGECVQGISPIGTSLDTRRVSGSGKVKSADVRADRGVHETGRMAVGNVHSSLAEATTGAAPSGGDGSGGSGGGGAVARASAPANTPFPALRRLPHIGALAVSLSFLIDFAERYVAPSQPTWSVVEKLVKPHTLQKTIRYVDLPHVYSHTLPAGRTDYYFVSHAWGRPFWEMVGLCAHYLRGAVAKDTYVWCDIFIINQHPGQQQADDLQQLRLAVRDATAVLVCTDAEGAPFERIWCLFEMWTTLTTATCSDDEDIDSAARGSIGVGRSRSQALVVLTTSLSAAQRAKLYGQIDAATAKATVPSDKERILADIGASRGGITAFNAAMRCALLLRPLDYEGELASLTEGLQVARGSAPTEPAGLSGQHQTQPQTQDWDFSPLDSWLALPPGHNQYRTLALLGGPATGKSSAAAAAMKHLMRSPAKASSGLGRSGGGMGAGMATGDGVPVAAHFCRASNLQALDPLAAMRTLAYQLSLIYPDHLQEYYAFELAKNHSGQKGRSGGADGDGYGSSFVLQAIAGMAAAEGAAGAGSGGGSGDSGGGSGQDPVAAAFEALLLQPLELLWKPYEDAVQATAEGRSAVGEEGGDDAVRESREAADAPALPPPPPRLVIVLDAVDEGDSGAVGGSHENAMLLLLQEHFSRLPPFVRLIVTARPQAHIRALLAHKFNPWIISTDDLRPHQSVSIAALAARLARQPALAAAVQQGRPEKAAAVGAVDGNMTALAERLWRASNGWMLFLRLAGDIIEAAAAAASVPEHESKREPRPLQQQQALLPMTLTPIVEQLEVAAVAASAPSLYALYMRMRVAPAIAAAARASAAAATDPTPMGDQAETTTRWIPTAGQMAFLLEVLGAAREPLYLSQLQDLGLPAISPGESTPAAAAVSGSGMNAASTNLRLGCLVNVRGYKLHGVHRSLLEWLAAGGADQVHHLLDGSAGTDVSGTATASAAISSGGGLRRGHAALAAMTLRDVAAARASQGASRSSGDSSGVGGGARGPRSPDLYSLQHAVAHVLEAAAAMSSEWEEAALNLMRTLFLDFYFWRCVYQEGSAASVALAALLRHEAIFHANVRSKTTMGPAVMTATAAATWSPAALAADVARWLQSYHGSLLRFPEAILQSALALPSSSPIRAAALAALAPPRTLHSPGSSSQPVSSSGVLMAGPSASPDPAIPGSDPEAATCKPRSRPSSSSGVPLPSTSAVSATAASTGTSLAPMAPTVAAQLSGTSWPKAFFLSNRPAEWDACLLAVESRGVTRGVTWVPEPGLVVSACDDRKVHLLSPITGAQVGLMEGHTDRVYCVALRPNAKRRTQTHLPKPQPHPKAQSPGRGSTEDRDLHPTEKRQAAITNAAATAAVMVESDLKSTKAVQQSEAAVVVASGSLDGRVVLWDGLSRMQLQVLEPGEVRTLPPEGEGEKGAGRPAVTSFGFSVSEDRPVGPSATGSVDCLAFSPDGTWLAAGTSGGSITVWRMVDQVAVGDSEVTEAAAAPAAAAATATGAAVLAVKVWVSPNAHKEAVEGLTFLDLTRPASAEAGVSRQSHAYGSNGGGLPDVVLASCSEDGCIHIWDPKGDEVACGEKGAVIVSEPLRTLRADSEAQVQYEAAGLQQPMAALADPWYMIDDVPAPMGPNSGSDSTSSVIAASLLAGVAEDTDKRQSRASYRAPEHHCLAAGPGLPRGCLLAGSGSGPVVVWDVASGLVRERLRGHVDAVHCLALQYGGPHFASGSGDCTVRLWRHLPTADPHGWHVALQAARRQAQEDLAVQAAAAEEARVAQLETVQSAEADLEVQEQELDTQHNSKPPAARICRRPCQWQCVALLRGHTRLVTSLTFLTTSDKSSDYIGPQAAAKLSSEPGCHGSMLDPGSGLGSSSVSRLASASVDFSVRIWQVDPAAVPPSASAISGGADGSGRPVGHDGYSVNTLAVSPDGHLIATGADDFQVCVWDGANGTHRRTLRCFYGRVRAVAFSRDSKRMATAAEDGGVLIFDITKGDEFSNIGWCRGHTKAATGVAFSPDGFSLASSSEDGTARVWAVRGFQTALLEGHPSGATAIAWAEEGSLVATGAARGNPGVQLWDARMGMRLNTFRYHVADVALLAFGSCLEPPPLTPTSANSRPQSPSETASQQVSQPRRHVLLMSVDVRGLACVWDVWGGGLLHYIDHVQGADLTGSKLLWLQARAIHYADIQDLLQRPPSGQHADINGGRQRRLATALVALYPSGEAVEVTAAGKSLSSVAVVTDKQRLYIFRPM